MAYKNTMKFAAVPFCFSMSLSCSKDKDSDNPTDPITTYKPMLGYSMYDAAMGDEFLNWGKSVVDDTRAISEGKRIQILMGPGEELLSACSGRYRFTHRADGGIERSGTINDKKIIWEYRKNINWLIGRFTLSATSL